MGRVTFEGPLKANQGFELGSTASKSSVAGTPIYPATLVDLGTQTATASLTVNANTGSIFKVVASGISNGSLTLTPIGGFKGQVLTVLVTNSATIVSVAFASTSSIQIMGAAASISPSIGSTNSITLMNVGAGLTTPTTSTVWIQLSATMANYFTV